MARLNRKSELWSHLTQVLAIRDQTSSPGNTTLSAAAAAGATSLTVNAITNFAVGEPIRVGRGEEQEYVRIHGSTAPTGSTITLEASTPLRYAHAIGDPVYECVATDVGHIEDGGVTLDLNGTVEDVNSAIQRMLFGQLTGFLDIAFSFGLLGFNVENLAFALGMLESRVLGTGGPTAPRTLTVDFSRALEVNDIALQFLGATKEGKTVRITAMACELDPSIKFTYARGSKLAIPVKGNSTGGLLYETW